MSLSNIQIIVFYFCLFNLNFISCNEEQCSLENKENCSERKENRYTTEKNKSYSKYTKLIENALENYVPCNNSKCSCHSSSISKDLKIFYSNGVTKDMINSIRTKGTKYQIINHKLYRDKDCSFPSRCEGIEHFILKIIDTLPNTELIINPRDWPQVVKNHHLFGPVFSFSKTKDYNDIMYPAWSFWEGGPAIGLYPRGLGRWDKHRTSVTKAADAFPWYKKLNKAFFRGSRTSSERDAIVLLSREKPDLIDAKYTKNQAWKSDADTLHAPPASEVSLEDHCKYKFLFNFRGVAASFRFKHLFLCRSLVFHVGDDWLEFFYPSLKPWVHYIPVHTRATKEQIDELIQFAIDNDELVKGIAKNGYDMIWNNLKMVDVECYWKKLLKRYTKLLKFETTLDDSLIQIKRK